jgi:hypothetical protein
MTFETLNTENLEFPWTRWFIYGDTGSGKTTAASTFPRPLFLVPQSEMSITTLARKKFPYIQIVDKSSPLKKGVGGMVDTLTQLEKMYESDMNNFPYDTIVCESMTHYMELVQDELTEGNRTPMDVNKYGKLAAHIRNIHARLSDMQVHVVYTALGKWDEKSDKGSPYLPGKTGDLLPSACEVYAYMTVKDQGKGNPPLHIMHTRTHAGWKARTRLNRLPAEIRDFNFKQIEHLLAQVPDPEPVPQADPPVENQPSEKQGADNAQT